MEKYSIMRMAMGAIEERVDYEMSKIVDNILDPNTKPDKPRKITLTLEFTPNSSREKIKLNATAKTTLVPTDPVSTSLALYTDRKTGGIELAEIGAQVPGQIDMSGDVQPESRIVKLVQNG